MSFINYVERRRHTRFEVSLPLTNNELTTGRDNRGNSRDISSKGVGLLCDNEVTVGSIVDIILYMPDNNEQIKVTGRVVWACRDQDERNRAGVDLGESNLKPVPIVLRSIKIKSRYTNYL